MTDDLDKLGQALRRQTPPPSDGAKARALAAAMENFHSTSQGSENDVRPTSDRPHGVARILEGLRKMKNHVTTRAAMMGTASIAAVALALVLVDDLPIRATDPVATSGPLVEALPAAPAATDEEFEVAVAEDAVPRAPAASSAALADEGATPEPFNGGESPETDRSRARMAEAADARARSTAKAAAAEPAAEPMLMAEAEQVEEEAAPVEEAAEQDCVDPATCVAPGMRLVSIRADQSNSTRDLRPDDVVDVYWTGFRNQAGSIETILVLEDIRVVGIEQANAGDAETPASVGRTRVEVSPLVVATLAQAQATGDIAVVRTGSPEAVQMAAAATNSGLISLRADVTTAVADSLQPGDLIDLYWSGKSDAGQPVTKLAFEQVMVRSVDRASIGRDQLRPTVNIEVEVELGEQVAEAATLLETGRFSLVLRGAEEPMVVGSLLETEEDLDEIVNSEAPLTRDLAKGLLGQSAAAEQELRSAPNANQGVQPMSIEEEPVASAPSSATPNSRPSAVELGLGNDAFAGNRQRADDRLALELRGRDAGHVQVPEANSERFPDATPSDLKQVKTEPVSTFSIDVDTASYSFVRSSLMQGQKPDPASVRIEEMINYFDYDYPMPEDRDVPFRTSVSVTETPWNEGTKLIHIGIQGYDLPVAERPAANLVFLLDTSGSMNQPNKLPLLIQSFRLLLTSLGENDTVAIVTYAGSAGTVLEPTPATDTRKILDSLTRLHAGGSTAGHAGLQQAYALAEEMAEDGDMSRVILATDGDFNVGISDTEELKSYIDGKRKTGIYLSVLGFGRGNTNDALMQVLAQNGNGTAAYIDTLAEAQKVLVEEASGALFPIANDVKIQMEFNPGQIAEYRLIGYETRALKREDFNNDAVDAGEIGAGHSVTAIYEVTPVGSPAQRFEPLRYGEAEAVAVNDNPEFGFLRLRYKLPGEDRSKLIETPILPDRSDIPASSVSFATSVAGFGAYLRESTWLGAWGPAEIQVLAAGNRGEDRFGYRAEFLRLVGLAQTAQ